VTYFHSPQNSMIDEKLLPLVKDSAPATIPEVVTLMENVGNALTHEAGLKWFNFLYLSVTKEILNRPPAAGWRSPAWLTRLDVVFAGFYFSAIADAVNGKPGWRVPGTLSFRPGTGAVLTASSSRLPA
jgi:hypothetical protein